MNLPREPGLQRRIAYSESVRQRNSINLFIRNSINLSRRNAISLSSSSYETLVDLENVKIGLNVNELTNNSTILINTSSFFCSICQDSQDKGALISRKLCCGHDFHIICVENWLSHHKTCPICRYNLSLR